RHFPKHRACHERQLARPPTCHFERPPHLSFRASPCHFERSREICRFRNNHAGLAKFRSASLRAGLYFVQNDGVQTRSMESKRQMMATFVLIHGAMVGGWCWRWVKPYLRDAGHEVYAPTLTGLGERLHLAIPKIDLDIHIQDIVNVLHYEDLTGVI